MLVEAKVRQQRVNSAGSSENSVQLPAEVKEDNTSGRNLGLQLSLNLVRTTDDSPFQRPGREKDSSYFSLSSVEILSSNIQR